MGSSSKMPFYVVSEKLARKQALPSHQALYELSSMSRNQLLKHHNNDAIGLSFTLSEWEEYVQEIEVPCMSPLDLLAEVHVNASEIDLLKVDTEGSDGEIVQAF